MYTRMQFKQHQKKKKWPWITAGIVVLLLTSSAWYATERGWVEWNQLLATNLSPDSDTPTEPLDEQEPVANHSDEDPTDKETIVEPEVEEPVEEEPEPIDRSGAKGYEGNEVLPTEPTIIKGILVASKQYPLPQNYAPGESEEAREAFRQMAAEAQLEDITLVAFSTFRSFERQQELYDRYVKNDGQEAADRYSARPGYSEHQTGLAFDIGEQNFEEHFARESFGETAAGKWVAANAHHYGFIMRYPEGKEKITGYMYEPWHFRYVGKDVATQIYEKGITLEDYIEE